MPSLTTSKDEYITQISSNGKNVLADILFFEIEKMQGRGSDNEYKYDAVRGRYESIN